MLVVVVEMNIIKVALSHFCCRTTVHRIVLPCSEDLASAAAVFTRHTACRRRKVIVDRFPALAHNRPIVGFILHDWLQLASTSCSQSCGQSWPTRLILRWILKQSLVYLLWSHNQLCRQSYDQSQTGRMYVTAMSDRYTKRGRLVFHEQKNRTNRAIP